MLLSVVLISYLFLLKVLLGVVEATQTEPEHGEEIQTVYGRASIQIDILSRSLEARQRRAELLMALNSFYSKEIQENISLEFLNYHRTS